MLNRRLAVWAQSFAGAVLGIAAVATAALWSHGNSRAEWAIILAGPLGCVFGLQLGGKVLLKQTGLNLAGSCGAAFLVLLLQVAAALLLEIATAPMVSRGFRLDRAMMFAAMAFLMAMGISRLAAATFNAAADRPV